ncbi:hypothetical protein D3C81_2176920 [compost metagenome]
MIPSSRNDSELPSGQLRAVPNCCWIRLPIISVLPPPRIAGVMKAPRLGTNTSKAPAITPGIDSGRMIRRNACQRLAPRS